ncbi:K(+)-transporting ATPase subunit C [Sphingobacteriaceae bacterium WQ 2009]|uniref:Potassium-transporting ATPase KdpC subunit n=1 Tax=Rhinopithecimicrobium faecis TaxID=2820698 RepID=A0A8T4HCD4_9SPHI|nr:K(+)-transporting ATPase subunit C [Sphingobacteriaceae bacterium WQ 2009]
MKKHILPAIKLTAVTILLFALLYPLAVWMIAQISPNKGKGDILIHHGKKYYSNIGQSFTNDEYFWSRPSAVAYNAAGSGGSNKGPSNEEYLLEVQERIDTFLLKNPAVRKEDIPVDIVTASGSGLDPNISIEAAKVQVKRISKIRAIEEPILEKLIADLTEQPLVGLFGPSKINVLKLNIALDEIQQN